MRAIVNAKIVKQDHIIPDGAVILDGERIVACGRGINVDGMDTVDAGGAYVGPGFIELHTHAAKGMMLQDEPVRGARVLLEHGVTDTLVALYFSADRDTLIAQMKTVRSAMNSGKAPNILGLYMEAPYMNPKFGANRENNPWRYPISRADYLPLIREGSDMVKIWCLAPEREGIQQFVEDALSANSEVRFSVAHSEAEPYQIEKLIPYGLRLATHHTNATGTLNRYPECRGVCVDEAAWYNNDISTELICDKMGIHVDPYMIRLVKKIKGDDRIILISDSFVDFGPTPPGYDGADDINFDMTGEISGTKLTLNEACRNMMFNGGASIAQCFRYASYNLARLLGLNDRGSIEPGKLANLVVCDGEFNVQKVFYRGNPI